MKYRVLIVDDEQIMCDALSGMMSKIPQVAVEGIFKNGFAAQNYLESHWVDAVITDISMPIMDGLELAKFLSENRPECKCVLISAYSEFAYAKKAIEYGVKDYITKPVRFQDVNRVIDELMLERLNKYRSLLYTHDMSQDKQANKCLNTIFENQEPQSMDPDKKHYFTNLTITDFEEEESEFQTASRFQVAITNILRWSAPLSTSIVKEQQGFELEFLVFADNQSFLPHLQDVSELYKDLTGRSCSLQEIKSGELSELKDAQEVLGKDEMPDEIITKAKEFIRNNLSGNLSRAKVAEAVHLDSAYFSKYFKKKCGINFHEYLLQEQISKAKELLEKGHKVKDAAAKSGFANADYFNRVFKQYTGKNPSDYRRKK